MTDLKLVAAAVAVEMITPEQAVKIGEELLISGMESPAVIQLASLPRKEPQNALHLLAEVIREQGIDQPGKDDALFSLGLEVVRKIADGRCDPIEGATWIWTEVWSVSHFEEFSTFVALADDLDAADSEEARLEIAGLIRQRARVMCG